MPWWPRAQARRQSQQVQQQQPSMPSGVGGNYQPHYLPHPAAVDPYTRSVPLQEWRVPKLSLQIEDLANPGVDLFLQNIKPYDALRIAVLNVLQCLYTIQTQPNNVRSVTLFLRDFPGVAHANGSAANDADKEIHFSTRHIRCFPERAREEILGVLTHEMVHHYQYNAKGTCPGGMVEGIADFVRLRSSLSPHWKRVPPSPSDKWDSGYEPTAFFLDWVERTCGTGAVRALNEGMRASKYNNGQVWRDVTGRNVEDLWTAYRMA